MSPGFSLGCYFTCLLYTSECSDSETGDYISYAIIAVRIKENDGAVTAEEICTVHDVFLNESRAREFAGICNELGLSPVHIYDAVQDAIG